MSSASKCASVSIHAPARGATGKEARMPQEDSVSIHAPARGATHYINRLIIN